MTLASLVIIANLVTIGMQIVDPKLTEDFYWLNQFFLIFYIVEFTFKAALWQWGLLIGKLNVVWWNWLDLIIVISGMAEMWVLPLLTDQSDGAIFWVTLLRSLRLLRLLRFLKLIKTFLVADTSWVIGERFQIIIMVLIILSTLFMGFECDSPMMRASLQFIYWEHLVLAIFTFELVVRFKHEGRSFFTDPKDRVFNLLDFIVVIGGIVDLWLLPSVAIIRSLLEGNTVHNGNKIGKFMMLLRMARLLRIFRLVRLIKAVPQLFNLVTAVIEAMAGMVWVMLLTMIILYFFALLSVKLFRDGLLIGEPPEEVQEIFLTVPDSIFILFIVMDGHKSILDPLFEWLPMTKLCFVIFVMLSEWCILSFLTGVVSENMIRVTEKNREAKEKERLEEEGQRRARDLDYVFAELDEDKNGCVDMQEFDKMLKDDDKRTELCSAANLNSIDLQQIFNLVEKNGVVHHKTFLDTLTREHNNVTQRSLMMLDKRLAEVENKLSTASIRVDGASASLCNGKYKEFFIHNNKAAYRNTNHSGAIIYFDLFWKINDNNDLTQWRYRIDGNDELTSATVKWLANDAEAARGIPMMSWEWHHRLDSPFARMENRFERLENAIMRIMGHLPGARAPLQGAASGPPSYQPPTTVPPLGWR